MESMKWKFAVWILSLVWLLLQVSTARKVSTVLNPGCDEKCDHEYSSGWPSVVYTKSEGDEDTVHHLWSTGVSGNPSLLLLQTSSNASLLFKWAEDGNATVPSVSYHGQLLYAFALVFNKIWEYRDVKDKGSMSASMDDVSCSNFSHFSWQNVSVTLSTSDQHTSALFQTVINSSDTFDAKGLLSLQLETHGDDGRSDVIPRLLYSSNSSQVRMILNSAMAHFEESRFALEVSVFINEGHAPDDETFKAESVKTMDDEYTPGVFKSMHLLSGASKSYLSWKPVAYTTEDLSVTDSTSTVYYDYIGQEAGEGSLAESFFRNNSLSLYGIAFNVSFGNSQDGFYNATRYTQWSFSYGLGVPGEDRLSSLVMIVIASGLGIPMLLIVLSSVYLGWHKYNMKRDDLSLSRR